MRFSINLRGDLAKLSDAELADLFEKTSRKLDTAVHDPRSKNSKLRWSFRGPLRHPWFYPMTSVFGGSIPGMHFFKNALGPFLSTRFGAKSAAITDLMDQHLLQCELRDLNDEMERRVARRRAPGVK
jgi:hypothetical protein